MIELIPVIEIQYNNQGVTPCNKYPYWDNSAVWEEYHDACHQKAGFKEKLISYLKGSPFYKLSDISDNNLAKLTIDHTQEMRDGKYQRPQDTCTFFGGYVLRIDGQDKFFPQCCGLLSDIYYWEALSNGQLSFYEGHPSPKVEFKGSHITFDFLVDEFYERFEPTPPDITLSIDRFELKKAVEKVKIELRDFEQRLNKINQVNKLNIDNIGELLIWENENYN